MIGPHDPTADDLIPPVPAAHVWDEVSPRLDAVEDFDRDGVADVLCYGGDEPILAFGPLDYETPLHEQSVLLPHTEGSEVVGDIDSDGTIDAAAIQGLEDGAGVRVSLFGLTREPAPFADFSSPGLILVGRLRRVGRAWLRTGYGHPR